MVISDFKIGIDVDDCVFPLIDNLLKKYNFYYKENIHLEDIKAWDIHSFLPHSSEEQNVFEMFVDDSFIETATPYLDAVESIKKLCNIANVYFISATHPRMIPAKSRWLAKWFPFIPKENHVWMCHKQLLSLDALVDDNPDNLKGFTGFKFLIDKPWNKEVRDFIRLENVGVVYDLILTYLGE